uniref:RanBP2-type domain-containing protein n=1 Tax=Anopheles funestus TaxID=62324 RepID=A0A182R212_ANOFN
MSSPVSPSDSDEYEEEDEQPTDLSNSFEFSSSEAANSRDDNETSCSEADRSFVGKIRDNVTNLFSKLIRNAKDKFGVSNQKRSNECIGSGVQPAKRRRLYDNEEDSYLLHDRTGVRPSDSTRIDQASQTNHPYVHTAGTYNHKPPDCVQSVFERGSAGTGQGESSVFLPSISHHSMQHDELVEQQVEGDDDAVDELDQNEGNQLRIVTEQHELYNFEPFDPFKYLAKIDNTPVDPKRRITTFLGNRCYRKRQQRLRRGVIGRLFFVSHHKPTKNLDTSRNETYASSHRPAFNMAMYRVSCDKRIPPELGGSPFYNGFTRYGGASAANTLRNRFTVTTSSPDQDRSVLIRNLKSNSKKRRSSNESSAPTVSSAAQRMLDILDEYDVAKKNGKNVLDLADNKNIEQELNELINRPLMSSCTAPVPQMLQLLRQQKLASILCEREESTPYPPIKPLNIMPLGGYHHTAGTSERRNNEASAENRTAPTETRTDVEPVMESNVESEEFVQRTVVQHLEDVMPSTPDAIDPPSPVIKDIVDADTLSTNNEEHEPAQTVHTAVNAPTGEMLFSFAETIVLDENYQRSETNMENMQTFTFAEPQWLNNQSEPTVPANSFQQLIAESANKWVCDVCMVRNEPHLLSCIACGNVKTCEKIAAKSISASSVTNSGNENGKKNEAVPVSPFSNMHNLKDTFKSLVEQQKTSTWLCDGCEAPNSVELDRCLCCEQIKPNVTETVLPNLGPSSVTPKADQKSLQQPAATGSSISTTTGTIQEPQPCSFVSFKTQPTVGLPSLGSNIFTNPQANVQFTFGSGAGFGTAALSTTSSIFGASPTVTEPNLFASAFGTNPTKANANDNTVSFSTSSNHDGIFNMFDIAEQPPANLLSSSRSSSAPQSKPSKLQFRGVPQTTPSVQFVPTTRRLKVRGGIRRLHPRPAHQ